MKRLYFVACVGLAMSASASAQTSTQAPSQTELQAPIKPSNSAAATALTTADDVLDHYLEAVGGRAKWQRLTSRISTGTIDVPAMNLSGTIEIREKAPNRMVSTVMIGGSSFRQGFDGTVGWSDDPQNGVHEEAGTELAETRRQADFYHPLDLHTLYTKLNLVGKEKVGDRLAYLIEGTLPEGGDPDKMYFDAQSGLLVRMITRRYTPAGESTFQIDLEDYREVDGIKLPFTAHQSSSDMQFTVKFDEMHHNVAIDDGLFSKPAAQ
jgi:hypothetical protein